jgi:transcription antitermination factor NusG
VTHRAELYPWFAIRTRSRAENAVANRLAGLDLDTFVPRYLEPVKWSDRLARTWRPLFPGYMFARFNAAAAELVTRTAGVIQVLGMVDPQQIESIRIAGEATTETNLTPCSYRTGQLIRITSGPFTGCEGIVDRADKNRRILKIDLLRRAVSIEIDRKTSVEPVALKAQKPCENASRKPKGN